MSEVAGVGSGAALAWDSLGAAGGAGKPKTVAEAAKAFEALLIGQMLKASREAGSGDGWLGTGEDATGASVMEFAEQQFAQMLSSSGGLGLGRLIEQGLSRSPSHQPAPAAGGQATPNVAGADGAVLTK